jgi:hypothetical protein
MSKQEGVDELFEGRHFDREVIILCVRWYLRGEALVCGTYLHQSLHTRLHNALNHQERQAAEAERQPNMTGIMAPGAMETRYGTTAMLH